MRLIQKISTPQSLNFAQMFSSYSYTSSSSSMSEENQDGKGGTQRAPTRKSCLHSLNSKGKSVGKDWNRARQTLWTTTWGCAINIHNQNLANADRRDQQVKVYTPPQTILRTSGITEDKNLITDWHEQLDQPDKRGMRAANGL